MVFYRIIESFSPSLDSFLYSFFFIVVLLLLFRGVFWPILEFIKATLSVTHWSAILKEKCFVDFEKENWSHFSFTDVALANNGITGTTT